VPAARRFFDVKVLGIVGGIGPDSTIDYYRSIVHQYRQAVGDGTSPVLLIRSIDVNVLVNLMSHARYPEVVSYLSAAIASLAAAGADFAIISANTPHIVFDELQALSPIPLLSIVEATCQAAKALQLHRLGLIGTRFTMKGDFYPRVFSKEGIELVVPSDDEQDYIHEIYLGELLKGTFLPDTRQRLCKIVERLVRDRGIQGAILAGTELPLLLDGVTTVAGVPFLDTTQIHVQAAVAELLR
jgi:aspartate racemase